MDVSPPRSGLGPIFYNVLATRHAVNEVGACKLSGSNYAVTNPVALGNIIITNSNYGGGLDLYVSTRDKLTNN